MRQVVVTRPNGTEYVTQFYACDLCTTMFMNPRKFATHMKVRIPEDKNADA
ncbi:MAG: hypothetical protein JWR80_6478 [Bradyrhizobium sp.]|nr:hypothetical protein [Bradyrhizobium sp.]